jgi:hypothetical protein
MNAVEGLSGMSNDEIELFAWIGEDEFGSGEVGLKQGLTQAGYIPLVAIHRGKMDRADMILQLERQAAIYGKKIQLARFKFVEVLKEINP